MTADQRRNKRRHIRIGAHIDTSDGSGQIDCTVKDVSQTGARVKIDDTSRLPDDFILRFTKDATPRRHCRVVWRSQSDAGVMFLKDPARNDDLNFSDCALGS